MNRSSELPGLKILVVEDSKLVRDRVSALVDSLPGLQLVAMAETAADAVDAFHNTEPDLVILDLLLQTGSGLDVLRVVKRSKPECVVIVFTNHDTALYRKHCFTAGATAFVSKSQNPERLEHLLRAASGAGDGR